MADKEEKIKKLKTAGLINDEKATTAEWDAFYNDLTDAEVNALISVADKYKKNVDQVGKERTFSVFWAR